MKIPFGQYRQLLVNYLKPQWPRATLLAGLLFSSIGLQLVNPQILRYFIDAAQLGGVAKTLLGAALLFIGVALVQQVVSVLATYVGENVAWTATNALRTDLAEHCLRLDMSFHNAHTPGEMIERIDGDVTTLSNFFSQFVIQVLGNVVLLVGVLALLFREDWRVGLTLTGFSVITLGVLSRLQSIAVPHWTAERQANADLFGFLEERLSGTEDIRANGAEAYVMRGFYRLMRELMKRSLKAALMVNILFNTTLLSFALGNAAAFAVGAWLFQEGVVTIGTVYIVFHYATMLERPIELITRQLQDLQKAGAGMTRVRELLDTQSKIRDVDAHLPKASALPAGALAVEFRDVTFGYDDALVPSGNGSRGNGKEVVLQGLSFRLSPGRVLGLLGRTGSGKTTLTRLLFRLYDLDGGAIRLGDGVSLTDLSQVPLSDLRQRVGMVTQNVQLFHATVRDNVTLFDDGVPDEKVLRVIQELGLGKWLESLPGGLDTELESGGGLSAGEAQLLALARIFLQDPGLVILDEASSRLDPATEHLLERAVDRLVRGRTAIIIAHRLGTVQRADEIMILENGRIGEYGVRAGLANDPGSRFYSLLQTGLEEVLA
ncbi:MAG: ABC transporter ATP-binding protein [Anaerolineae bacterium]|nr:MAG: ABC transporter ATP-binding protein [Anaerolineae bacterium]